MSTFFNSWIEYRGNVIYRGVTAPDPSKFQVILVDNVVDRTTTLADIISDEVLPINGYERINLVFGEGTYSTPNQRLEYPDINIAFAADSGTIQFRSLVILADASPVASKSFTNANVNATSNTITISNHGFVNGNKLIFTPATLATLPGGVTEGDIYEVISVTTNTFQLSGLDITDTGSGTFYARSANGRLMSFYVAPTTIQIFDAQEQPFVIPVAAMNTGIITGV
jgi:hypothetical protein